MVTLLDASAAVETVRTARSTPRSGAVTDKLPSDLNHVRIIDDELQLLVPAHPLAQLAGSRQVNSWGIASGCRAHTPITEMGRVL